MQIGFTCFQNNNTRFGFKAQEKTSPTRSRRILKIVSHFTLTKQTNDRSREDEKNGYGGVVKKRRDRKKVNNV